jgi:hypothetical protein
METSTTSSLRWGCLVVLVGSWDRKARCLACLPLILVSSLLVVLAVLLMLLRELPLELLLVLTLMLVLVSLRVTLLELRGWIARETGTTAAPSLRSINLALQVFHLPVLPFSHDSSIDQMLKCRECMVHQLVVKGINQTSQEPILSPGISIDILRCVAR